MEKIWCDKHYINVNKAEHERMDKNLNIFTLSGRKSMHEYEYL